MTEACGLVTQRQLGWLSAWHLREDSHGTALARLADAQHRIPLAAMFGSGTASSSDGQNFPLDRRAQATGAINPHKGSDPAISFYTHVSDPHAGRNKCHTRYETPGRGARLWACARRDSPRR